MSKIKKLADKYFGAGTDWATAKRLAAEELAKRDSVHSKEQADDDRDGLVRRCNPYNKDHGI